MHTWKVLGVQAFPNLNGKSNVVHSVHWQYGPMDSKVLLDEPTNDFIEFNGLTEPIMLEWVWKKIPKIELEMQVNTVETAARNKINNLIDLKLPWA